MLPEIDRDVVRYVYRRQCDVVWLHLWQQHGLFKNRGVPRVAAEGRDRQVVLCAHMPYEVNEFYSNPLDITGSCPCVPSTCRRPGCLPCKFTATTSGPTSTISSNSSFCYEPTYSNTVCYAGRCGLRSTEQDALARALQQRALERSRVPVVRTRAGDAVARVSYSQYGGGGKVGVASLGY